MNENPIYKILESITFINERSKQRSLGITRGDLSPSFDCHGFTA